MFANKFLFTDKPVITVPERLDTIELRTIQRRLKELKEEGLVIRIKDDQYILSNRARSDIRYFPKDFRNLALYNVAHVVNTKTHEEIISELVNAFGSYVIYCFIEALKPTPSDDLKISLHWLEDVLSPFNLYLSFLSALNSGKNKQDKPLSDFDNKSIEALSRAFQKKYPLHYEQLLKSKTNCL